MNLLPEDVIDFDDQRPYHQIDMYKKMVRYHIGLLTRSIAMNNHNVVHPINTPIRGSFPKQNEIQADYKSCDGDHKINFPIAEDVEYKYLGAYECYFMSCDPRRKIHAYRYQNTIFICAEQGERYLDIRNYKHTYDVDNYYGEKNTVMSYERLSTLLNGLKTELETAQQIVLIGHSNGMASAILTAFLFSCLKREDFFNANAKYFDRRSYIFLENIRLNEQTIHDAINRCTLYVVGTGGFPVLFESQEEFKNFFNEISGRYVHIVDGFEDPSTNKIYADFYASTIVSLVNIKFGLYFYTNVLDDKVKDMKKYNGTQCSYGVIIDDARTDNEWRKEYGPDGRPYFVHPQLQSVHALSPPSRLNELHPRIEYLTKKHEHHVPLHSLAFYRDILAVYFFS